MPTNSKHPSSEEIIIKTDNPEVSTKVSHLQQCLESGKISRRNFISTALTLGVSMSTALSFVDTVQAATPKKGGRLRQGLTGGATSDTYDPGQMVDTYMINLLFGQVRNNLSEVAPNGELVPELAESWEATADAKAWHFKLRQGVEFHNGKTLDSQDIIDSLNHHITEDSTSAAKGILSGIVAIKADGPSAVNVELSGGDADFPFLMSDYHLNICPSNGDGTIDWQSGIGTGGYSIADHSAGVRTFTKRNPNYWKEGTAHFDEIESLQIADASARVNGLRTGTLDCFTNVDLKTAGRLGNVDGITVRSVTGNKQITLPMWTNTAPFDNNDVRLAIKHIIKRDEWLDKVIFGYGQLGNDNPIGPANIYRATEAELPQRTYDVDKAKYHLKQAGMEKLNIQFHAAETGFGGAIDAAQLIQESAAPAGINIEVIREPDDGYWSNVWMQKPWVACYWSGRPTENWMFSQVYASDASWNDTFWKNDRFDELLILARAELDSVKRRELYVEMQQIVNIDGGVCLPLFLSDVMAHAENLFVPEVIGNNLDLDGSKNAERWWFA